MPSQMPSSVCERYRQTLRIKKECPQVPCREYTQRKNVFLCELCRLGNSWVLAHLGFTCWVFFVYLGAIAFLFFFSKGFSLVFITFLFPPNSNLFHLLFETLFDPLWPLHPNAAGFPPLLQL